MMMLLLEEVYVMWKVEVGVVVDVEGVVKIKIRAKITAIDIGDGFV